MTTFTWRSGSKFVGWSTRFGALTRLSTLACIALCVSCGDDDDASRDAGSDAAVSDAAVTQDSGPAAVSMFGPCATDVDCPDGTFCDREIPSSIEISGAPTGMIERPLFPGGSCSPKPLAPFDSTAACDSSLPQAVQGCGSKGTCILEDLNDETYAGCRAACEPSATTSGCAREGYTCDFGAKACVEGCRDDVECRVIVRDSNNDGTPDTLAYDTMSEAYCDEKTGRCTVDATATVPVGSSCERLDDCSSQGYCLEGARAAGGLDFPGGYCTAVGCDVEGRECPGSGAVCEPLRPWLGSTGTAPLCLQSCEVGAESADLRIGASGHGMGCREGYRCHYNGGMGTSSGVCVGGVYNDVTRNNVGEACTSNSDCYSPYGYGVCLLYTATSARIRASVGSCTILDCNAPGIPDNVCGPGNECIPFAGDLTFCIHNCATADDCPTGYACADEDADPTTTRVCFPACLANTDCRSNQRCQVAQGATAGRCVAMAGASG